MRFRFVLLLALALVPTALAARPASAVTRADALDTVLNLYVYGHPEELHLQVYGPLAPIAAGTPIGELFASEPVLATPGVDIWFFWIDYFPRADFAHETRLVGVRVDTGAVLFALDSDWWPVIGGVERYRRYDDRAFLGEQAYGPPFKPALPPPPDSPRRHESGTAGRIPSPAPPASGKVCALIVCGEDTSLAASDNFRIRFLNAFGALDTTNANGPRVHPDSIRTAVFPDSMDICDLIESVPKGYDKLYLYWVGHGERNTGRLVGDGVRITPTDLMCKIKEREAKDVCLVIDACYAGNHLPAMCEKGLCGSIMTSSNATESGWQLLPGFDGRGGGVFNEAWVHCMKQPHLSAAEVYACARDSVQRFCAALPANDPKTRAGGQHPRFSSMYEFTESGQHMDFHQVPGCPTMCFEFYDAPEAPDWTCANATLYCQLYDVFDIWNLSTVWYCLREWNWNVGKTRYYNPPPSGPETGRYQLAVNSNAYPVRVGVTWPDTPQPDTPSSSPNFPSRTIGWRDNSYDEFGPTQAPNQPHFVYLNPFGYWLCDVPRRIGVGEANPLRVQMPLTVDPLRDWLYTDGDPLLPFNGEVMITVRSYELQDPALQVDVEIIQLGLSGNTVNVPGVPFLPNPDGSVEAVVILPQGGFYAEETVVQLFVDPLFQNSYFLLDAVNVDFVLGDALSTPPDGGAPVPALSAAYPNPFRSSASIRLALAAPERVNLDVFDVRGRRVRSLLTGERVEGKREIVWDGRDDQGRDVPAGAYFYRLAGDTVREVRKLVRVD